MTSADERFKGLGPGHAQQDCPICKAKARAASVSTCPPTCINRLSLTCAEHRPEAVA